MVLVVLVIIALSQGVSSSTSSTTNPLVGKTGKPASSFMLSDLSRPGRTVSLGSFRGRPLVINFWASWCIPCRAEMPLLEQAFRAEGGKVQFLGIDSNDTSSAARSFLAQVGVTYPVGSDETGDTASHYGLLGLPTTIFVSPSGRIAGRIIGQLQADSLRTALKDAFRS